MVGKLFYETGSTPDEAMGKTKEKVEAKIEKICNKINEELKKMEQYDDKTKHRTDQDEQKK
ncbi:MAG: hypothetical protein QXW73_09875 [Nitrososphaerales archaeon]